MQLSFMRTIVAGGFAAAMYCHAAADALSIRTAHDSAAELATKARIERLAVDYDLKPWTFTHEIIIDEKAIPHSHPVLTLHTRHLNQEDELLSTYVHEQLHWFLSEHEADTEAAERDLMKIYPNVPVGYPEGGVDRTSTYLHLLVCRLEQQADEELLGKARTDKVMQFWATDHYTWVYHTVLQDGSQVDAILQDHGLGHPSRSQRQ